jgi:inosine-uridine nucleoside N-ribohydrolase
VRRLIVDTDPGIDDTAAFFMAFGSGNVEIDAVTTVFGNSTVDNCTRNALTILEAAGHPDIPVHRGAGKPLLRESPGLGAYVHGEDGMGEAGLPAPSGSATEGTAAVEIVRRVMAAPGEIDVVALGPQTNVALALCLEPDLAGAVRSIVVMGGTAQLPGNVTPVATANHWYDPEAAAIVYGSGAPVVQAGLDVARLVATPKERLEEFWATGTPPARVLEAITPFHDRVYQEMGRQPEGRIRYNDVPTMGYLLAPELYETLHAYVAVETHGEHTLGQTVVDVEGVRFQPPNVHVCTDVDADGIVDLFVSSLMSKRLLP